MKIKLNIITDTIDEKEFEVSEISQVFSMCLDDDLDGHNGGGARFKMKGQWYGDYHCVESVNEVKLMIEIANMEMRQEQDRLMVKKTIEMFAQAYAGNSKWGGWWASFRHRLGFCYSGSHDWVKKQDHCLCQKCGKVYYYQHPALLYMLQYSLARRRGKTNKRRK